MQIDRDDIERNLPKKGFVAEEGDHRYFYHEFQGRRTGPFTFTSRGSQFKTYGSPLLSQMKKQLRLETAKQVVDLCKCPISAEEYNEILKTKGVFQDKEE
ncbi:MAG: hypothetical protein HY644_06915 [Acidobacteria bacterium]|nr:hypothetical protein [Acidobacteriota bacterium]